jgi:ATP-dependent Clp protease ATP-binding subunit ClpX
MAGHRNAYCSFCRKGYRDVGPLVEGPGDVYICGECTELCQAIIEQERWRRSASARTTASISADAVRQRLDQLFGGQEEAKRALALAVHLREERWEQKQIATEVPGHVLLIGPSRSSKLLLARAVAHVVQVPFAEGNLSSLAEGTGGTVSPVPLLYRLLLDSGYYIEAAQRGIVYVDGVDGRDAQEALLRFWEGGDQCVFNGLPFDIRAVLFVCGGTFAGIDQTAERLGRHPEQPVTGDALIASGVMADFVGRLAAVARVAPLDEGTLGRMVPWVDFSRMGSGNVP